MSQRPRANGERLAAATTGFIFGAARYSPAGRRAGGGASVVRVSNDEVEEAGGSSERSNEGDGATVGLADKAAGSGKGWRARETLYENWLKQFYVRIPPRLEKDCPARKSRDRETLCGRSPRRRSRRVGQETNIRSEYISKLQVMIGVVIAAG